MKLKFLCIALAIGFTHSTSAQKTVKTSKIASPTQTKDVARPKLVVGLVVDQMRWDYLYRFYSRYGQGGFKRLLNEGFSAENTLIPYTPTFTACGHASIYTGTVPAINGIIGNSWYVPELGRNINCVEDLSVATVGSTSKKGLASPKNLLVTTVTDELRMATNFRSKVISISLKDRGAILPGGHSANGSYWLDDATGNFITSTHYMAALPNWVNDFNGQKLPNSFFEKDWNTLYPIGTYTESTADHQPYEKLFKGEKTSTFPHLFKQYVNKNYGMITSMPYGNTFTLAFAKNAIQAENLGQAGNTDFLAVSLSSTDYIGHQFGPNSIELEDTYLRLDKDLEDFFSHLDKTIGKGNYLFFLSSDHGVVNAPGYAKDNKLPGSGLAMKKYQVAMDSLILSDYKVKGAITALVNNQIMFNADVIKKANADYDKIKQACIDYLIKQDGVLNAVDIKNIGNAPIPAEIKSKIINGYNAKRSGEVYIIIDSGWYPSLSAGSGHGAWNPYDSHIPAVFMGWGVKPGKTNKQYYMTDIAPTISALLKIQEPSGSIGTVITELIK